jgi:hypothetical protein
MKIPITPLRTLLGQDEVVTFAYMGWAGLSNGELLRVAEDNGIEVLLTGDQSLNHGQTLVGRDQTVVALPAIQLPIIKSNLAAIARFLSGRRLRRVQQ